MTHSNGTDVDLFMSLRKFLVPEIVYGEGAVTLAGRHAANHGASKVLIVTDPGVREAGWAERVEKSLRNQGVSFVVFDQVSPNPKDEEVMAGTALYRDHQCDLIIAVGGGSPMDCAKGIGVLAGNTGHILEYEGVDEVGRPGPPMIFIPTTAGSSADVSQFAIITDTRRRVKIAIISKMVIPDIALVDPETTGTMPKALTAATGMDALCHAIEALVSTAASPLTDMAAESAIRLVFDNIDGACHQPETSAFRHNMMMASLMAGLAFSNAGLGLVHAMAHSLGGFLGLPHGECNALLLEKVVHFNHDAAPDKYHRLACIMGVDTAAAENKAQNISEGIAALRKAVGIHQSLRDMGVSTSDLDHLARMAGMDPCLATNPREASFQEIRRIFETLY